MHIIYIKTFEVYVLRVNFMTFNVIFMSKHDVNIQMNTFSYSYQKENLTYKGKNTPSKVRLAVFLLKLP